MKSYWLLVLGLIGGLTVFSQRVMARESPNIYFEKLGRISQTDPYSSQIQMSSTTSRIEYQIIVENLSDEPIPSLRIIEEFPLLVQIEDPPFELSEMKQINGQAELLWIVHGVAPKTIKSINYTVTIVSRDLMEGQYKNTVNLILNGAVVETNHMEIKVIEGTDLSLGLIDELPNGAVSSLWLLIGSSLLLMAGMILHRLSKGIIHPEPLR